MVLDTLQIKLFASDVAGAVSVAIIVRKLAYIRQDVIRITNLFGIETYKRFMTEKRQVKQGAMAEDWQGIAQTYTLCDIRRLIDLNCRRFIPNGHRSNLLCFGVEQDYDTKTTPRHPAVRCSMATRCAA